MCNLRNCISLRHTPTNKLMAAAVLGLPLVVAAQTQESPLEIKSIKRIEQVDVLEETRIEKEVLEGGYICFKAYRLDAINKLDKKDLEKLHSSQKPDKSTFETEVSVKRWVLVSIDCEKQ